MDSKGPQNSTTTAAPQTQTAPTEPKKKGGVLALPEAMKRIGRVMERVESTKRANLIEAIGVIYRDTPK